MCGCDYNENIFRVGPAKAFKLLLKHGNIENVPLDTTCLNYKFCREQFKVLTSKELIDGKLENLSVVNPNNDYLKYTKQYHYNLISLYKNLN